MVIQKNLKITILGKQYCISTDEDSEDVIKAAQLVDNLMQMRVGNPAMSDEKIAVIVALQLASELHQKARLLENLEQKTEELKDLLESELQKAC
jgi:cell division protein ZapA (FtsZ GTPase activity inhibitor)